MTKRLDIVVFGATGFTGALVAEYLAKSGGADLRWAIAGRSRDKLEAVAAAALGASGAKPEILIASVDDGASLRAMAESARVVLTTVGPFVRHGEPVVAACVDGWADYVDITGEPMFVDRILEQYDASARDRGLRLVSCCGFDSIPPDLGALFTARELGPELPMTIEAFVQGSGKPSGGSWHTAVNAMAHLGDIRRAARGHHRGGATSGRKVRGIRSRVRYEPEVRGWVAPMPTIDPQIVLRSARALELYGPDFRYGHYARFASLATLIGTAGAIGGAVALAQLKPTRELLLRLRQPGEGPDAAERERSSFRVTFIGRAGDRRVVTRVSGGDPGYGETAKMVAESALCLARDRERLPDQHGALTPAVAMGTLLLDRLVSKGIRFEILQPASRLDD
jgi:short subunit dehydrogenase-like uncharacterized protein